MLSKQVTKIVQNLEKKKFREKYNLFKIEGEKLVGELLHSPLKIHSLIAFPSWLEQNKKALSNVNIIEADEREMHGISNFQSYPKSSHWPKYLSISIGRKRFSILYPWY